MVRGDLSIRSYFSIKRRSSYIYSRYSQIGHKWGGIRSCKSPVRIGNRLNFGLHSIFTSGITIGDGFIIGSNSLVNKVVPTGMKVWGNPSKIIGEIDVYD